MSGHAFYVVHVAREAEGREPRLCLSMARALRLPQPTSVYHVMARGRGGQDIFLEDADRTAFLAILGAVSSRMRWACFAYCLMNNHYHLLLETGAGRLLQGMRQLNSRHARTFNRAHGRRGGLFRGRIASSRVDTDAHLKETIRYILLNPVRAKIARDPGAWPWSSYRATIGEAPTAPWLAWGRLLSQFGSNRDQGIAAFINFTSDGPQGQSIWSDFRRRSLILRRTASQ